MLSEKDFRELLDFSSVEPVLSVYLNTDPANGNADVYRIQLRNMLKLVHMPQDVEAMERYFQSEFDWSGRGVAAFSCASKGYFRAFPLAVPVYNLIYVGDRPNVKPLTGLLDSYGGYGVILVDRQGARLFHFHLGELTEQEGYLGEAVKRTKDGGASSMPGRRGGAAGQTGHVEEVIERNMKEVVDFTTRFLEEHKVRRVLIGGTDENVNLFRGKLPKAWQSLVVGAFNMPMTASHHEVQAKALQVGQEAEARREAALVSDMVTRSAKGANAVTGLEAVLEAVNASRVQTLVIADGFRKNGYRDRENGLLLLKPDGGNDCEKIYDIVDLSIHHVLRTGGEIEVVRANAELEASGSIGALLRY